MGIKSFFSKRAEWVAIGLAFVLFGGGLFTFLSRDEEPSVGRRGSVAPDAPGVGPTAGQPIPPYIEARKARLAERAAADPKGLSFAVVSFTAYRAPKEVDVLLASRKLSAVNAQWRVPREGAEAITTDVKSSVDVSVGQEIGAAVAALKTELKGLEDQIADAKDPAAEAVFNEDASGIRETIAKLEAGPIVVYAVLVRASYGRLLKISTHPEVRLVDVPDDAAATPESARFSGISPDQS